MKRLCLCSLIVGLLLTGCGENRSEIIELYGHTIFDTDNSTIQLKDGYFVRDYSIDYENKTIVMNLERDEE